MSLEYLDHDNNGVKFFTYLNPTLLSINGVWYSSIRRVGPEFGVSPTVVGVRRQMRGDVKIINHWVIFIVLVH